MGDTCLVSPSGIGNEIKRITAIASNDPQPYNTGSYLKNVRWYNSKIGTSSTSNHQWLGADTAGYCTYPNSTQVSSNFVNAGEETVSIIILDNYLTRRIE